jgi:hypothetical protein
MKKIIITLLLSFVGYMGVSQSTAIKMQLHYWNKPEQNFEKTLTSNGKILLDSLLAISEIDTSKCIKVDRKNILEYTSKKFLTNHSYTYISYSIYNGVLDKTFYQNFNGYQTNDKSKIILYQMSDGNMIDVVSIYVIQ